MSRFNYSDDFLAAEAEWLEEPEPDEPREEDDDSDRDDETWEDE